MHTATTLTRQRVRIDAPATTHRVSRRWCRRGARGSGSVGDGVGEGANEQARRAATPGRAASHSLLLAPTLRANARIYPGLACLSLTKNGSSACCVWARGERAHTTQPVSARGHAPSLDASLTGCCARTSSETSPFVGEGDLPQPVCLCGVHRARHSMV